MNSDHNSYFDEAYFQRGDERGTAYRDYARAANESPTYREIAEAIVSVFQPRSCLEIGCATGAIVRSLADLGVDAHGIDVSEWAVKNRLHRNVMLAGVDSLPFEDARFDLVFSCHALEHIPAALAGKAFAEMTRVASPSGYQFHMLPIVGTYPYNFDHDAAREALRADPTHHLLEPMQWWHGRWEENGWQSLPVVLSYFNDTNGAELSSGQYAFSRKPLDADVVARAFEWNKVVHRRLYKEMQTSREQQSKPMPFADDTQAFTDLIGGRDQPWLDFQKIFEWPLSVDDGRVEMVVELLGETTCPMRMALIDDSKPNERGVLEYWMEFQPGLSVVNVPIDQFRILEGNPDLGRIDKFFFGGDLRGASFRLLGSIKARSGSKTRLT